MVSVGQHGSRDLPPRYAWLSQLFSYLSVLNFDLEILKPGCVTPQLTYLAQFWFTLGLMAATAIIFLAACCVRYRKDLGYSEIQERLMALYPQYRYLPLTTREASMTGKVYIQDLISSGELDRHLVALGATGLDPADTHIFLCGNPKMIGIPAKSKETGLWEYPQPPGVIEILEARGFRADNPMLKIEGNIHFEKYW